MSVDDIWSDDYLDRKTDAEFLINYLISRVEAKRKNGLEASYSLNIDARWGDGKTFFLERLGRQIEKEGHISVHINAWKDDHASDPLVPISSAIDAVLKAHVPKVEKTSAYHSFAKTGGKIVYAGAKAFARTFAKKHLGQSIDELMSESADDNVVEGIDAGIDKTIEELEASAGKFFEASVAEFRLEQNSIISFRNTLSGLITSISSKETAKYLFVLVDELDRCKPTYAIALLERVKHLFSADNVIFIFGTNVEQLSHSVNGAYGGDFDGRNYLNRFFDRTYKFKEPKVFDFIRHKAKNLDISKLSFPTETVFDFLDSCPKQFDLSLRDFEQCFELLESALDIWDSEYKIELTLLFPSIVSFIKLGDASFSKADTLTKFWTLRGININPASGQPKNRYLNDDLRLDAYFKAIKSGVENLDIARELDRAKTQESNYAFRIFSVEWNGKIVADETVPSIQAKIPEIVQGAARFT